MSHTIAKTMIRALGTLGGLFGAFSFWLAVEWLIETISAPKLGRWLVLAYLLAVGAYLLYFAYLVWFRFSPRAVRHTCGILGVCVLSFVPDLLEGHEDSLLGAGIFLGSLLVVYSCYKVASSRLNRWLSSETSAAVRPSGSP